MKKLIFPVLVTGFLAVSCSKKEKTVETPAEIVQTEQSTEVAKMSPVGTFEGTIPCASCPGIETKLTLNEDKTFTLDSNYLEEKDGKMTSKGTFVVSEDGEFVTTKAEGTNDESIFYLASDAVYMVTKVGDKEMRPDYKLAKK